jgi:O-antigen ligase
MGVPGVSRPPLAELPRVAAPPAARIAAVGKALSAGPTPSAALLLAALIAALFFNGVWGEWFGLALLLLTLALVVTLWRCHGRTLNRRPAPLEAALGLYVLWLAITLVWHPVPQVGIAYFWILGAMPLAFLLGWIEPEPETMSRRIAPGLLAVGLVLALLAAAQFFLLHNPPRSLFLDINSHAAFLNLVALAVAGRWLGRGAGAAGARPGLHRLLLPALALLLFSVFLTRSRGASLALTAGIGFLLWASAGRLPRGRLLALPALTLCAFLAADALWSGGVADRIETLFTPASAGADRFIIWRQAWAMLLADPWTGAGIGTFWLHWPRWRDPLDTSGGFFAHNDYLQLWIEAGLPGLLLLLAVMGAALHAVATVMSRGTGAARSEAVGLAAALGATALHGFFNFNLYQLPILMVTGLFLARLDRLALEAGGGRGASFRIGTSFTAAGFRAVVAAVALLPVAYFASQAAYAYSYRQAVSEIADRRYAEADQSLLLAARLAPLADNVLVTHADLLRRLLDAMPAREAGKREFLFAQGAHLLARARALNPLRAEPDLILGVLLADHPELAGDGAQREAAHYLRQAMERDPRLFPARMALARQLRSQDRLVEARQILEEGLRHWYPETPDIVPYYRQLAAARLEAGDVRGAERLGRRTREILAAGGEPPPEGFEPTGAMGSSAGGERAR